MQGVCVFFSFTFSITVHVCVFQRFWVKASTVLLLTGGVWGCCCLNFLLERYFHLLLNFFFYKTLILNYDCLIEKIVYFRKNVPVRKKLRVDIKINNSVFFSILLKVTKYQ